ncbi:hypothetical protein JYU34_014960 [Plutella xylostella]|uniref:Myrosinase 1-like n=1 Tax=Plutella xylostella TaxID=51655 RepID=A0ABQ7Q5Y4_PLUXY|nr:hypothetical protein JYU34_014960 [Plutella xylostella]
MAKELGLDYYRFSISWPRLVPNGFADQISEDGKNYYNKLIDGLLANGIEPVVTLYHWDLPQRLQDYGGWLNPLISDWFADYARVAFSLFGDRVTTWLTINEALVVCTYGYGMGVLAPGISENDYGKYVCIKNIVMAHGKAYRVYEKEFKAKYPYGKISLANHFVWYEGDATAADDAAAELMRQQSYGLYCHPIFSTEGGWPQSVAKVIAENSKREGYPFSRLPDFTQEEIELVRGTYDYLGLNHYTSRTVIQHASADTLPANIAFTGSTEFNVSFSGREEWGAGSSFWFRINPPGLRSVMRWIKQEYGNVDILITENGYSDKPNTINDDARVDYYRGYLEQVLLSIKEDGVNVTGYTAWTLMDNFEWIEGYTSTFGLYQVDFSQAERPRTPRKSARYYASIVKANSLDVPVPKDEL